MRPLSSSHVEHRSVKAPSSVDPLIMVSLGKNGIRNRQRLNPRLDLLWDHAFKRLTIHPTWVNEWSISCHARPLYAAEVPLTEHSTHCSQFPPTQSRSAIACYSMVRRPSETAVQPRCHLEPVSSVLLYGDH